MHSMLHMHQTQRHVPNSIPYNIFQFEIKMKMRKESMNSRAHTALCKLLYRFIHSADTRTILRWR